MLEKTVKQIRYAVSLLLIKNTTSSTFSHVLSVNSADNPYGAVGLAVAFSLKNKPDFSIADAIVVDAETGEPVSLA